MSARSRRFPWWGKVEHWAPDWPPADPEPALAYVPLPPHIDSFSELESAIGRYFDFTPGEIRMLRDDRS